MAFTTGSSQITVYTIQGDGQAGYWWISVANGVTYALGYMAGTELVRIASAPIYGVNTFKQLMTEMVTRGITLPPNDVSINLDDVSDQHALAAQFSPSAISTAELTILFNHFDREELLVKFGLFPLVRRSFEEGLLTLLQLRNILIALGAQRKITRNKAEAAVTYLQTNNFITAAQASGFWTLWDAQVGA